MTRLTLSFSGLHNHLGKPWPENLGPLEVCSLPDGKKGTRQRAIALGYGGRRASICFPVSPPTSVPLTLCFVFFFFFFFCLKS